MPKQALLLLLLLSCGKITGGSGGSSTDKDTGVPWWESAPGDADGDGYTVSDGDCDDTRADVNPGVRKDTCDGVDQDCDGRVDEDFDGDDWEPNDNEAAYLGQFSNDTEALLLAYLPDTDDVDFFAFEVQEDSLDWFDVEVWLYNTPEDARFVMDLYRWEEEWVLLGSDTANGRGNVGFIDFGGSTGWDDSGTYLVGVYAEKGGSCAEPYTLQFSFGGW
jgi:hypothetical protein